MKILCASRVDPQALERLENDHEVVRAFGASEDVLADGAVGADVIIFRSGVAIGAAVLDAAPDLQALIRAGSGLDNVDLEDISRRGLRLVRVPAPSAQAVAEFTLGLLLGVARNVALADRHVRAGSWPKADLVGNIIAGKTVGILGLGNIGSRVGELCGALGMDVVGCVEQPTADLARRFADKGVDLLDFGEVVKRADVLSVNLPLTEATRAILDRDVLSTLPWGSFVINTARGGILDEAALFDLIRSGHVAGAALDVHDREGEGVPKLAELDNVILTPHIGAMARETQQRIGERVVEFVRAVESGTLASVAGPNELII